jgi:hypothetical protein
VDEVRVHLVQAGAIPIVFSHLNGSFPNHFFDDRTGNAARGGSSEHRQAAAKAQREQTKAEKLILRR